MNAFAPDGTPIRGTYEILDGVCPTQVDAFTKDAAGRIEYEHADFGTEIFWDGAESATTDDQEMIFLDTSGRFWKESQLVLFEGKDLPKDLIQHEAIPLEVGRLVVVMKSSETVSTLSAGAGTPKARP